MRIEISGLNRIQINRARVQLNAAGFEWRENERFSIPTLIPHTVTEPMPVPDIVLSFESDDPAALRAFLYAALHEPHAKVYR